MFSTEADFRFVPEADVSGTPIEIVVGYVGAAATKLIILGLIIPATAGRWSFCGTSGSS